MRPILPLFVAFALGIAPTPATADDYEPQVVHKCTVYKTVTGKQVCGFEDIEEWKLVLEADAELVHARAQLKNERNRTTYLAQQVRDLKSQVGAYASSQEILVGRVDKLTSELIEMNRKYENERARPRIGSPLAWAAAAISVSVLGGFLIADLTD